MALAGNLDASIALRRTLDAIFCLPARSIVFARTSRLLFSINGRMKDFKLNTQCSAGNGYFLQSTAEGFGLTVNQYAIWPRPRKRMPVFGYGCAVFMQSDIVNFQRQAWQAEEILAGLAAVLPKNVFLYVASIPKV